MFEKLVVKTVIPLFTYTSVIYFLYRKKGHQFDDGLRGFSYILIVGTRYLQCVFSITNRYKGATKVVDMK